MDKNIVISVDNSTDASREFNIDVDVFIESRTFSGQAATLDDALRCSFTQTPESVTYSFAGETTAEETMQSIIAAVNKFINSIEV